MQSLFVLLIFTAVAHGTFDAGLRVRYDVSLTYGDTSYFDIPRTTSSAVSAGWIETDRPDSLMSQLKMYCYEDYVICALIEEDTGSVAGLRISMPQDQISDDVLDWSERGFTNWTLEVNGTNKSFWSYEHYYTCEESLKLNATERMAARDTSKTLSEGYLWMKSFDGELMKISSNYEEFKNDTRFTKQACLPWMGHHFYYQMSPNITCTEKTLLAAFPLFHSGEAVGVGLYFYGVLSLLDGQRNWWEYPPRSVVEYTAYSAPQCVYELADSPGMVTIHTYFIDKVRSSLTCLD